MGLFAWILIVFPFVLILGYLAGRQYRGWRKIHKSALLLAWILAGLLVLGMFYLPSYRWINTSVIPFQKPWDTYYARLIGAIPVIGLVLATVLVFFSWNLLRHLSPPGNGNRDNLGPAAQRTGWIGVTSLIVAGLLFGSIWVKLYYVFIWDSTTDSMIFLLLLGPLFAVVVTGVVLSSTLSGRDSTYGLLFTFFLAVVLVFVYIRAKQVDYHLLTERHAAVVTRAVDGYYTRHGQYPENLRHLVPWTVLWLPKPVIMHGMDWCYQSGEGYYRLGYVSHDHWSSPMLTVRVYKSEGSIPDLPALCQAETDDIKAREPIFSVVK